jgi:UDP-N-acetylglucosamine 2-epimerase (non-hydrolysing)
MAGAICVVVGARPNFMKAAPVYRALQRTVHDRDVILVHTGQHYDEAMSDVFLADLGLPRPDVFLGAGSGSHAQQTARVLTAMEQTLVELVTGVVVVFGDINSTLAAGLAAVKLDIPVAHVEAGLRSFDLRMPEEHNRKLTDHLSAVLLAHSRSAVENLAREGIDSSIVHLVGNTMIDTLLDHVDGARARSPWERWGLAPREYGLATLHRPSLVDDPTLLAQTVEHLVALSDAFPIVFPVHPRTVERIKASGLDDALSRSRVVVTEPLGYREFLGLEAEAAFVLTDSGGIQEETSVLGVRCFTLRDSTERPVTIELGTNMLLGARPERIADIPALLREAVPNEPIPLWDGGAGDRAAAVIAAFLG